MEYKITLKKFFGHLHTINKHRFIVFKLSIRAGIPLQGLVHDLSKYSPVEFFEGVKYFQGDYSPIRNCKKVNDYSKAWLHHKGRNKHHYEYWYDENLDDPTILMPYKFFAEMVCDTLSAAITYNKDTFNNNTELEYYMNKRKTANINKKIDKMLIEVYKEVSKSGIKKTVNSKNLKEIYNKYK